MNVLTLAGASGAWNLSSVRCRMTSAGVEPSACRAMKCSTSPNRKNRPVAGSLTTKESPWGLTIRSLRSFGCIPAFLSTTGTGASGLLEAPTWPFRQHRAATYNRVISRARLGKRPEEVYIL